MVNRGWKVITVDIDPSFNPDIIADITTWSYTGDRPDLMWFSPPCDEFARESMPWCRTGKDPDLSLYKSCLRIVSETKPRFWIIENVKGAVKYFGTPKLVINPYYFWGFFPHRAIYNYNFPSKQKYSGREKSRRALIPMQISEMFAYCIENQPALFDAALHAVVPL